MKIINYKSFGIGIRISLKYGTIYRVKGNKGLLIRTKNDNLILVGIKNETEISKLIKIIILMKKLKINTFYFLFFFMFQILSYSQFDSKLIGSLFINSLLIEKDFLSHIHILTNQ